MKITLDELYQKVTNKLLDNNQDTVWIGEHVKMLNEQYGYPIKICTDYLTSRVNIDSADEKLLFAICSVIYPKIDSIYTDKEIELFKYIKYTSDKVKFPIKIKSIKVTDKQYIAAISAKQLMRWNEAGLINYNERTQRLMSLKTKDGNTFYQITLSKKAVSSIEEGLDNGSYVSSTITLNLPEDAECYYDEETGNLVIKELHHFDILDGYHRYVAMCRAYAKNHKWDYPMELRITFFTEEEARQFIYQEDQKTQMTKVDSNSFNQNDYGVQVTNYLNRGIMADYERYIDKPFLAVLINNLYFQEKRAYKKSDVLAVRDEMLDGFETLIEHEPTLIDSKWNNIKLATIAYMIKIKEYNTNRIQNTVDEFKKAGYKIDRNTRKINADLNRIKECFEKGE